MKSFYFSFLIAFIFIGGIYSQSTGIESRLTGVLLIEVGNSSGSGIVYGDSTGTIYLITAKHVIINQNTGKYFSNKIKVSWYSFDIVEDPMSSFTLYIDEISKEEYIKQSEDIDIIAIRVAHDIPINEDVRPIIYEPYIRDKVIQKQINIFSKKYVSFSDNYHLGDDAYLMGYPKALGLKQIPQYDFNRPLVSKGCISGKDQTIRSVIIDCPSYGGNSGGPVMVKVIKSIPQGLLINYNLIGFVVQFIPYVKSDSDKVEIINSGYSVVIPIEDALKLIANN